MPQPSMVVCLFFENHEHCERADCEWKSNCKNYFGIFLLCFSFVSKNKLIKFICVYLLSAPWCFVWPIYRLKCILQLIFLIYSSVSLSLRSKHQHLTQEKSKCFAKSLSKPKRSIKIPEDINFDSLQIDPVSNKCLCHKITKLMRIL